MPTNSAETITACEGVFYDDGGASENYGVNQESTLIIQADTEEKLVIIEFLSFELEEDFDSLYIYDGINTSSPLIFGLSGSTLPNNGNPIVSTGNALTFYFKSDVVASMSGWEANIFCYDTSIEPTPDFSIDNEITCDGAVQFFDETFGENISWNWDFGDGETSDQQSPNHLYTEEGIYTVSLEVCNDVGCGTITFEELIIFNAENDFCFEFSMPPSGQNVISACNGKIFDSGGRDEPYGLSESGILILQPQDADFILLIFELFNVEAGFDYLNIYDGADINSPILYQSLSGTDLPNEGDPISSTGNALTLQFFSDGTLSTDGWEASFECRTVTEPPQSNFAVLPLFSCDGLVQFVDKTIYPKTSIEWDFGDGNVSSEEHPLHSYSNPSNYLVEQTVCNDFGCTSSSQMVSVFSAENPFCEGLFMPTEEVQNITDCRGILYDTGGPLNQYSANDKGAVVIGSESADSVSLSFTKFNLDLDNDFLNIYDGADNTAPLIGSYSGSILPNNGAVITSSAGFMTVEFAENGFAFDDGFQAYWIINSSVDVPDAFFELDSALDSDVVPQNLDIQFVDASTNEPNSWYWDFGDGGISYLQNPEHKFSQTGDYTVSLIASNCTGSSEIFTKIVTVQDPAFAIVTPSAITVEITSGETIDTSLTINNFGVGDLIYDIDGLENSFYGIIQVLVYNYETENASDATTYNNTIQILKDNINGLNIFETSTTNPEILKEELQNMDVLLIPGKQGALNAVSMFSLAGVIQDFANSGGGVIFTASQFNSDVIFNSGIFDGEYGRLLYDPLLEIADLDHPVSKGIVGPFNGKQGCAGYLIEDEDKTTVIEYQGLDVVVAKDYENDGHAVLLGFNYLFFNKTMEDLLINSVVYTSNVAENQWLSASPTFGGIPSSTFQEINLNINATNTPAGTYSIILKINTNDPLNPVIEIPVTIIVSGTPQMTLSESVIDFGNVVQSTEEQQIFEVINTGFDTLFVTDIVPSIPSLTAEPNEFYVYPGLSQVVTLTYAPAQIEVLENIPVEIISNVGNQTVLVFANATGVPEAIITPSPVQITLNVGETGSVPVSIDNLGEGFLEFCIETDIPNDNTGFLFEFTTDKFPNELIWVLFDDLSQVVAGKGPQFYNVADSTYQEEITGLSPDINYTLLIEDNFAQCDGSLTSYAIYDLNTNTLIESGDTLGVGECTYLTSLGTPSLSNIDNWLTFDIECDTIPFPAGTLDFEMFFDSEGFLGGTYTTVVNFISNDQANPIIEIPVTMVVIGIPEIELVDPPADNIIDFGVVLVGQSEERTITITNTGTDTLHVTDFVFEDSQFSIDYETLAIFPGDEIEATISFVPTAINLINSTLTIVNDDENIVVNLVANALGAPVANTSIESLVFEMQSAEISSETLILLNEGLGPMDYDVSICGGEIGYAFDFKTDGFGPEFYWKLVDQDENVIFEEGQSTYASDTDYSILLDGLCSGKEYTLFLYDSFGDGSLTEFQISDIVTGEVYVAEAFDEGFSLEVNLSKPTATNILNISPETGIIDFPAQEEIVVTANTDSVETGVYYYTIIITNNDPSNGEIEIPVSVFVSAFPLASFTANNDVIVCGEEPVEFTDNSINAPTSWNWDFGDGQTSTDQNPIYSYSESGAYTVTLIVSNQVGADTLIAENLINVDMQCALANIPLNEEILILESCNGKIFDSGGSISDATGNYKLNSRGVISIIPQSAESITVNFKSFDFSDINDLLYIFDGPDVNSPLIGAYTGTDLPNGGTIVSSSGAITLQEFTNDFLSFSGFEATFACTKPQIAPIAGFDYEVELCNGIVAFTDTSLLFPDTWSWDFGDGNTSDERNPTHRYEDSGSYTVTLTAANDYGDDDYSFEIEMDVFNPQIVIPGTIIAGETADFSGLEGPGLNYTWDFGDGQGANIADPSHLYEFDKDTIITVSVTVINLNVSTNCVVSYENELHFFLEEPIGLSTLQTAVKFYPNPTTGFVYLELNSPIENEWMISVMNPQGKIFYQEQIKETVSNWQLDLSSYPNGLYNIILQTEEGYLSRKVVLGR